MKIHKFYILITVVFYIFLISCKSQQKKSEHIEDKIHSLAVQLHKTAVKIKDNRTAVVGFSTPDGKPFTLGKIFSEKLTTHLVQLKGVRMIDRSALQKILSEQQLSETGIIEQKGATEIGKLLGARFLITGTMAPVGESISINAKMIDTTSGEILAAGSININEDMLRRDRPNPGSLRKQAPNNRRHGTRNRRKIEKLFDIAKHRPIFFLLATMERHEIKKLIDYKPKLAEYLHRLEMKIRREDPEMFKNIKRQREHLHEERNRHPMLNRRIKQVQDDIIDDF